MAKLNVHSQYDLSMNALSTISFSASAQNVELYYPESRNLDLIDLQIRPHRRKVAAKMSPESMQILK